MSARFILLWLAVASTVWARGGGGCFEEGTPVLTPRGAVPIEQLRIGDEVTGGLVEAITRVEPAEYLELPGNIRITAEHPFQIAPGVFRTAERVFPAARHVPAERPAYNLLVSPGGTFVAGGFVVHNKGCFLPDTPILRADGTAVAIGAVRPGDKLLAFESDGRTVTATVRDVLAHEVDEYLIVRTDRVELRVTVEHPFYVGDGTFKTLEALTIGDRVFAFDGRGLSSQPIVSIERVRQRSRVFNLQTDAPNTFFANGIAVHNKGGGCFAAGTPVRTPVGDVAIEDVRPGDLVLTGLGGTTVVEATFVTRDRLLTLETEAGTLRTTIEHPVLCADGKFRQAGRLACGARLPGRVVIGVRRGGEELVYNLRVGTPHTFVAGGFVVHNKGGGCFPAGTRIRTPTGEVPIELLRRGDIVLSGAGRQATVEATFTTRDRVLALVTDKGVLRTTAEHPVLCRDGRFREAGELAAGARLPGATVLRCATGEEEVVYNLTVSAPHTFIADGFVVHNKGGGGFHSSSRSGSGGGGSDNPLPVFIFIGAFIVIVIIFKTAAARQAADENLDFCYSRTSIAPKANKTRKLLEFIARVDQSCSEETLRQRATSVFVKLQECWQAREYGPMQSLMMPNLYREHCSQLAGLRRNHEIDMIDDLRVDRVDIVNIRYTQKPEQREFTALITATARDYYIHDQTREFLRGDDAPAQFQEFWTFQWQNGVWVLREIEQTRESDVLKEENFFEQFTDKGVEQVYGAAAGKEGPAGPWLEKSVETKATRIDRLLNFLVQTDKLWDRQAMLERARQVFLDVMLAREAGDPTAVKDDELFPAVAVDLRQQIAKQRAAGDGVEFRNLCVRKAELILVRNFADNAKDEYIVRISAHAQRIFKRAGAVVQQDEYVTPFVEYWTFGRLDNQWKLKEVLPEVKGEMALGEENIDEDSHADQLQWYYRQTRAT